MSAAWRVTGRGRWVFRITCLLGTPVVVLLFLEVALRFTTPATPPIPRPSRENASLVDAGRNAMNVRERWEVVPGDADTARILFLGDSVTFGVSVEQEQCFVHLVEQLLNGDGPPHAEGRANGAQGARGDPSMAVERPAGGAQRVATINAGEPGSDPVSQAGVYQRLRAGTRSDVVVHVLYCNDLGHDLYDELRRIHALQNRRSRLAHWSRAWQWVERRMRYAMVRQRTLDYFRGGDSPFKREQAWRRLRRGVQRVRRLAREDGAAYCMVMFPWLFSLDDYPLADVHARMASLARELGVEYLDLLDVFAGRDADELRISVIDEHPNARGHRLAATAIAAFLRREMLPGP